MPDNPSFGMTPTKKTRHATQSMDFTSGASDPGDLSGNDDPHTSDEEDMESNPDGHLSRREDTELTPGAETSELSVSEQKLMAEKIPDEELLGALTDTELLEILMKKDGVSECGCSMIFTDKVEYYLHQTVHNWKYPLRCGLCDKITRDSISFMRHLIKRHGCTPRNG